MKKYTFVVGMSGFVIGMCLFLAGMRYYLGTPTGISNDTITMEKITDVGRATFTDKDMECFTTSATIEPEMHFAWDDKKVTISENDIKTMSIDELRNLGTLMSIFGILPALSPELMWVCGQKLLPRFFGQPEVK